jgi:hypothetical protein
MVVFYIVRKARKFLFRIVFHRLGSNPNGHGGTVGFELLQLFPQASGFGLQFGQTVMILQKRQFSCAFLFSFEVISFGLFVTFQMWLE